MIFHRWRRCWLWRWWCFNTITEAFLEIKAIFSSLVRHQNIMCEQQNNNILFHNLNMSLCDIFKLMVILNAFYISVKVQCKYCLLRQLPMYKTVDYWLTKALSYFPIKTTPGQLFQFPDKQPGPMDLKIMDAMPFVYLGFVFSSFERFKNLILILFLSFFSNIITE